MKINHISSTYSVVEHCEGVYHLVKIIGEYSTSQEAFSDMVKSIYLKEGKQKLKWN